MNIHLNALSQKPLESFEPKILSASSVLWGSAFSATSRGRLYWWKISASDSNEKFKQKAPRLFERSLSSVNNIQRIASLGLDCLIAFRP